MPNLFVKNVPVSILYNMLEKVCDPSLSQSFYIFTISSYKKLCYYGQDSDFLQAVKPYYYKSKRFYLERDPGYKSFCTVIRQICKSHILKIESKLNYCNSSYMMEYYISRRDDPKLGILNDDEYVMPDEIEEKEGIEREDIEENIPAEK